MRAPEWTPEEDEAVTKLWQDNVPCAEIARRMPGRTESAVLGRAAYLDLPLRTTFQRGRSNPLSRRRYDQEDERPVALGQDWVSRVTNEPEP